MSANAYNERQMMRFAAAIITCLPVDLKQESIQSWIENPRALKQFLQELNLPAKKDSAELTPAESAAKYLAMELPNAFLCSAETVINVLRRGGFIRETPAQQSAEVASFAEAMHELQRLDGTVGKVSAESWKRIALQGFDLLRARAS